MQNCHISITSIYVCLWLSLWSRKAGKTGLQWNSKKSKRRTHQKTVKQFSQSQNKKYKLDSKPQGFRCKLRYWDVTNSQFSIHSLAWPQMKSPSVLCKKQLGLGFQCGLALIPSTLTILRSEQLKQATRCLWEKAIRWTTLDLHM